MTTDYCKFFITILIFCTANSCFSPGPEELRHEILKSYPEASSHLLDNFFEIDRSRLLKNIKPLNLYRDTTYDIGNGQISSKPSLNIILAQELKTNQGDDVLEIGTGSGIQAALLDKMGCRVYTVEIFFPLLMRTKESLLRMGYKNIEFRHGDGYNGWTGSPDKFDRILITCAFPSVPDPLIRQLKEGGYLLMPTGKAFSRQQLIRYKKVNGKLLTDRIIRPVIFVPLLHH